jgi:hypothetical protein
LNKKIIVKLKGKEIGNDFSRRSENI